MHHQVKTLVKNLEALFENKLILLEAEYYAFVCNVVAEKGSYELSSKVSRNNGYIYEQGLSYGE